MDIEAARLLAAGICMGLGAIGPGIGEGIAASGALQAIGRNPEIGDKIFTNLLVTMAVTESTAIYSLVITLVILFVV
ncbi:ATP synthase F0 subunit C [Candidatus Peribacteria bacterium]|nr:ATP synthase F0 subunit C [Candidatus Peribacteria bacterium]